MLLLNKAETFEIYFPKSRQRYNLRSSRIISRASFWSFVNTSTHTVCLDGKRIVKNPLLCVRTITPRSLEVLEGKLTVLPVLKWIILRCIGSAQNYCRPSYDTTLFLTAIHERLAGFCRSLMNPDAIEPLHLSRSVVKLMVKKYSLRDRKLWPTKRRKSPTVRSTIFV